MNADTSLQKAATGKVRKYQHLPKQIQDLANAGGIKFVGFHIGERGIVSIETMGSYKTKVSPKQGRGKLPQPWPPKHSLPWLILFICLETRLAWLCRVVIVYPNLKKS